MAKDPTEFTRQNTQRAIQAANFGMNWYRDIAEQNLNQGKLAFDGLLSVLHKLVNDFENQSSAVLQQSMTLTHETVSNTFDLGQKLVRAKEPQELVQLQAEFLSRQAQAIADETKQFGQTIMNGAGALANTTLGEGAESMREHAKAA